jgi:glycosyltransferase involved in cell wall biosynthesis
MNVLFVHQGFPGQYLHLIRLLVMEGGHRIVAIGMTEKPADLPQGVAYFRYGVQRGNTAGIHPLALDFESKVLRGEACARAARELATKTGFSPRLICAHPGWGECLFLHDVWPQARLLTYQEFFYNPQNSDLDFDTEFNSRQSLANTMRSVVKNAPILLNLQTSDWCITPTRFQWLTFPEHLRKRISIIHDGIDTERACPSPVRRPLQLGGTLELDDSFRAVTFVNRTLEPYRGCHIFIRCIPELQRLAPDVHVILAGALEGVSYGKVCPEGEWHQVFLKEIEGRYDPARVHFTGSLPYHDYLALLQFSSVHVYLTYPFVVSWSLLEAMSCGCAVVGSRTAPVQEFIEDGVNGLLVDFFDPPGIAAAVAELLARPEAARSMGQRARQSIVGRYSLAHCLPRQRALLELVASNALPIPTGATS